MTSGLRLSRERVSGSLLVPLGLDGWLQRYRLSKTPMAPRRAPLTEQIERRISDPLCGAGGGFPLRQREYTFSRRLPSGPAALGRLTLGPDGVCYASVVQRQYISFPS